MKLGFTELPPVPYNWQSYINAITMISDIMFQRLDLCHICGAEKLCGVCKCKEDK